MKANTPPAPSFMFGGLRIYAGSAADVVDRCIHWSTQHERKYICVAGVHGVAEAAHNTHVAQAYQRADLIVPDGVPLVWIGKLLRFFQTTRIYGPDLMRAVCFMAERNDFPIYLYGTTASTLRLLVASLHSVNPRLRIAGVYAPPFRALTKKEERRVIASIDASGARIVFVGLSTPKQELWMTRFVPRYRAGVTIGVGAAFDFLAGTKRQAPVWVQQIGFEWIYRLFQEPRRLWKRYIMSFVTFVYLLLVSILHVIIPK